jgi:hypothetical protein
MANSRKSIFWSVVGILIGGFAGGYAGWGLMTLLELDGPGGALVAVSVGMLVATFAWIALTILLRTLRLMQ